MILFITLVRAISKALQTFQELPALAVGMELLDLSLGYLALMVSLKGWHKVDGDAPAL